mgnify:FL=1
MRLRNILVIVKDMERSIKFYHDLFGLDIVLGNDGNTILTEGLVLQDEKIWRDFLGKTIIPEMEVLRPGWKEFLKERLDSLYISSGENDYIYQKSEFDFYCPDWQIQEEQLLVYWIYTYFCGAVYDDEIFAKVKMAVVCTLFIHELNVGTYLKNNRQFKLDDQIRICYQFSRELEHSDLNLNRFEELMSEKEIFSFENLLKIC